MIVFFDASGVSQRPARIETQGINGETPVVQFHSNWHQLPLIAGMHCGAVCVRLHGGAIAKEQVVEFLKALLGHRRRPPLVLRGSVQAHRSRLVRDHVASTEGRIKPHCLAGYATGREPVEFRSAWLNRNALVDHCPDSFAELRHTARGKLKSAPRRSMIIAWCWQQAELF